MASNAFLSGFNKDTDRGGGSSSAFQTGFQKGQQVSKGRSTLKRAKKTDLSGLSPTSPQATSMIPSAKKGGRIAKGGLLRVHRGEQIIPAKRSRKKVSGKQRTITKP